MRHRLASAERLPSIAYLGDPETMAVGWAIIVAGASMAFCFNIATYFNNFNNFNNFNIE